MCNRPLVPPERWGLTSVWWAPHPWHGLRMRCTQCAVMLDPRHSSQKGDVCPVWSEPLTLPGKKFTQCATSPSSLRDDVYIVCVCYTVCNKPLNLPERLLCNGPLSPNSAWETRFTQCAMCSGPLTHPWVMRFTQSAVRSSSLRHEV